MSDRINSEGFNPLTTEGSSYLVTEGVSEAVRTRSVRGERARSAPDNRIYLYELDTTPVGGPVYTWTPGPFGSRNAIPSSWSGWSFAGSNMTALVATTAYPTYVLRPGSTGHASFTGLSSGQTATQTSPTCPATPGLAYAFTVLAIPYKCQITAKIEFIKSNGAVISSVTGNTISAMTTPASGHSESDWSRLYVEAVAPTSDLIDGLVRARGVLVFSYLAGADGQSAIYFQTRAYLGLRGTPGTTLWTPGEATGVARGRVAFNGVTYEPVPIQIEGIQRTPRGTQPRVSVSIPNINGFASQLLAAHDNLHGCKVSRRTTYKRFLDGMPQGGDASATFDPQVWYVDRVALSAPEVVQLECVAATDLQGVFLPVRTVLRDTCQHRYRRWNATLGAFTQGTCPYTGGSYYKADGSPTDPPHDDCGRRLSDCVLRFGGGVLPTRAFPGVGRIRS